TPSPATPHSPALPLHAALPISSGGPRGRSSRTAAGRTSPALPRPTPADHSAPSGVSPRPPTPPPLPSPLPEIWLRGPVPGVAPALQPVAHALLQAREDVGRLALPLTPEELWQMPGGAASIGFHLRHMAGSLDRLLTYARGEALTEAQRAALAVEKDVTP